MPKFGLRCDQPGLPRLPCSPLPIQSSLSGIRVRLDAVSGGRASNYSAVIIGPAPPSDTLGDPHEDTLRDSMRDTLVNAPKGDGTLGYAQRNTQGAPRGAPKRIAWEGRSLYKGS